MAHKSHRIRNRNEKTRKEMTLSRLTRRITGFVKLHGSVNAMAHSAYIFSRVHDTVTPTENPCNIFVVKKKTSHAQSLKLYQKKRMVLQHYSDFYNSMRLI